MECPRGGRPADLTTEGQWLERGRGRICVVISLEVFALVIHPATARRTIQRVSEAARRELQGWIGSLVCVSTDAPARCELVMRLRSVNPPPHRPTTVSLSFERDGHWCVDGVDGADVAPHEVVLHHGNGRRTQVSRLLLPAGLERALHVGEYATRDLDLKTVATPFARTNTPGALRHRPRDVVVWTEFAARSRLALWWACASFPRARVWIVPLPRERTSLDEVCCLRSPRALMSAAPGIRPLTSAQVRRFGSNWQAWLRGEVRSRRVDLSAWPAAVRWVGDVPQPLFDLLPRFGRRLRLAPYDQQLLELLGTQWSSTLEALVRLLRGPDDRLMQVWGDRTIHRRLHAWSRWQRGRFVEKRPSQADTGFSAFQYRLTPDGERLLSGLRTLDLAPPLQLGAVRSYVPGSWVMTSRGPHRAERRHFTAAR